MSVRLMSEVFKHVHGMPSGRRMLLLVLADFANDEGVCWPSIKSLATNADLGDRHVSGELKALARDGYITIEEHAGKSNHYRVNSPKGMNHSSGVKPSSSRTTVQGGDEPQFTTGDEPQATPLLNPSSPPLRLTPIEPSGLTTKEPPERARAKRATQVPDAFEVTDELYDWAWFQLTMPKQRVDAETDKFLDHFRANGKTMKDWTAAWKNWMRRSLEFGPRNQSNGRASPGQMSAFDETQAAITEVFERINGTRSKAQQETPDDVFETTWKAS